MFYHSSPRVLAPRRPATHTPMPGSSAFLGSPCLPVEDDWECRLWEETTIFIVWIKYFSWPSRCLLSVLFFSFPILSFLLPPSLPTPLPSLSLFLSPQQSSTRGEISRRKQTLLGWKELLKEIKAIDQTFCHSSTTPSSPQRGCTLGQI